MSPSATGASIRSTTGPASSSARPASSVTTWATVPGATASTAQAPSYQISCHLFDEPADWNRVRRMTRTGVRFAMVDDVVGDYWPHRLWRPDD